MADKKFPRLIAVALTFALSGCATLWQENPDPHGEHEFRRAMKESELRGMDAATPEGDQTLDFAGLMDRGDRQRDSGSTSDAVWSYLRASQLDPTSAIPVERVGFLHLRDDVSQAEIIFETLIESHPDAPAGHHGMAMVLLSRGDAEGAEESFTRALQLAPDAVHAIAGLGVVYDAQGRHAAAQAQYLAALESAPQDAEVLSNLGLSYMSTEQFDAAEGAFRRAVRLRPSSETFHNNLGLALGRQGRYDDALREFSSGGNEAGAENNLGYVYFLNGRYADAIAHYEQALGLGSAEPLAVVQNLRDAREAQGLESSALDAQAPIFPSYPEDPTELPQ